MNSSKYGGSMGQQRLIKTMKSSGGGGGGVTANEITTLTNRIDNLEKFAIQRTLDVVVTDTFKHNINIDLLTYESVQIDFLLKFTGTNSVPLKIEPVNGIIGGTWDEYNGTIVAGSTGTPSTLTLSANSGTILHAVETQGLTASISCKIFKVYDVGVHLSRYSFTATGLYCRAGVGHAKSEITAMCIYFRPTALKIHLPSSATLMSFSYSIINDKLITS